MPLCNAIGLMSGTSMDGIDAALLETDGEANVTSRGTVFLPHDPLFQILLKATENFVRQCQGLDYDNTSLFQQSIMQFMAEKLAVDNPELLYIKCGQYLNSPVSLSAVEQHSTQLHICAVQLLLEKSGLNPAQIHVIGYHGQTVLHQPHKQKSIQLGDAALMAKLTGMDVVGEFRQQDIENGGQGAPFAPIYHQAIALRDHLTPCVVVNCGGISNLTLIAGKGSNQLHAYDAGPGNCLLDAFVRLRTRGRQMMDVDGMLAGQGRIRSDLLVLLEQESCMRGTENFYRIKPPRSLDVNDFSLPVQFDRVSLEDGAATLTHFTAKCMVDSLALLNCPIPDCWILAGGGFNNPAIIAELTSQLPKTVRIQHAKHIGWEGDGLEAEIFAYLAVRSLGCLPLSLPATTGVRQPQTGGKHYFGTFVA